MTSRSLETTAMNIVDCPWCHEPAQVTAAAVQCSACHVTAELSPEPAELELAA